MATVWGGKTQRSIPPVFNGKLEMRGCRGIHFCATCSSSPATRSMILLVHFMNSSYVYFILEKRYIIYLIDAFCFKDCKRVFLIMSFPRVFYKGMCFSRVLGCGGPMWSPVAPRGCVQVLAGPRCELFFAAPLLTSSFFGGECARSREGGLKERKRERE